MNKNLLSTILSLMTLSLSFAQLPFNEDFATGIPASWQNIDNTSNNGGTWEWINDSGDQFAVFNSDGFGDDGIPENADLITPAIDCSSASFVAVSFLSSFRQYQSSVGTASISTDGGSTWTAFYTVNTSIGVIVLEDITAAAAGVADVRFKFNFVGNWDYFWIIDDFSVYTPSSKDFSCFDISTGLYNDIADSPISIAGSLENLGSETITSFDINYRVDGGAPVTAPITGVSIGFGDSYNFTHPTGFSPSSSGDYEITVFASNLNGGADGNTSNDEFSKFIIVFDFAVQRVPLFEIFTASTNPPCKPANENFHSIVDSKPTQEFVSIKYQEDFPGTGDPYATDESVARRGFYGINSIPSMEIDGGYYPNSLATTAFSQTLYDDAISRPSFTFLQATYEVNDTTKTVEVEVEGLPIRDYSASTYKLYVAIIENVTELNVKGNGETEFYEVVKKMLPDASGTTIVSLDSLQPFTLSTSYTFQGSYRLPANGQAANRINHAIEHSVEQFSDLRVVVWIQDEVSKDILQAFNAVNPLDSDGDGTPDEVEAYLGTGIFDITDFPDEDADGLGDWAEVSNGRHPLAPNCSNVNLIYDTICGGPYVWNNTSYANSGSYNQTFQLQNGCDSIVILFLTVYPSSFNPSFSSTQQLFTNPPFAVQFTNTTSNTGNLIFTWYWGDGTATTNNNPTVFHEYLSDGLYSVTLEVANTSTGCSDQITLVDYIFATGGVSCTHPSVISQSSPITACDGQNIVLTCNSSASYTYQWLKNGVYISGNNNDSLTVTQTAVYSVIISENSCPVASNNVAVNFSPIMTPVVTVSGTLQPCIGSSLTLNTTSGFVSYLWSNGDTTPSTIINTSGSYTVQVTDSNGCVETSLPYAVNASILPVQNMCIVGVDSLTNNIRVVWEKLTTAGIDSFFIYRETSVSDVYSKVGETAYDSLSVWVDPLTNPAVQAYRYKITALDTCGAETPLSEFHKTIHLTINQGVNNAKNLIWSHYEGITFGSYNIYRGTTANNLTLLTTIQSNLNSFTDLSAPTASVYYQIEVVKPNSCNPTKSTNYGSAKSNIVNDGTTAIAEFTDARFKLYPNPSSEEINIETTFENVGEEFVLLDYVGRVVHEGKIESTQMTINVSEMAQGVYLFCSGSSRPVKVVIN
ncbi:MAG: PKD domain-containing protein [Chitinophagales bacterium]